MIPPVGAIHESPVSDPAQIRGPFVNGPYEIR